MTAANMPSGNALGIKGRKNLVYEGIEFRGGECSVTVQGLVGAPSHHIVFNDCAIGGFAGYNGLEILGSGSGFANPHHITVHDCLINGELVQSPTRPELHISQGIDVKACDYFECYDNTVQGWGHACLQLYDAGAGGTVRYADVYTNEFNGDDATYNRAWGVMSNGEGLVSYNHVHHNTSTGTTIGSRVEGDHNEFDNNELTGAGAELHQQGTTGPAHDNNIHHNTLTDAASAGIYVNMDSDSWTKYGNVWDSNILVNCGVNPPATMEEDRYFSIIIGADWGTQTTIGANTYTNNSITSTETDKVRYRALGGKTIAEFNALNGTNGDVINGNT
jgi:hypothetical protein